MNNDMKSDPAVYQARLDIARGHLMLSKSRLNIHGTPTPSQAVEYLHHAIQKRDKAILAYLARTHIERTDVEADAYEAAGMENLLHAVFCA